MRVPDGFGAWPLALLLTVIFLGAVIQGTTGFGLGLVAAPVMAMVDSRLLPTSLILVSVPLPLLMALREAGETRWTGLGRAFVGRIAGTAVGLAAVAWLSPVALGLTVACSVLLAVFLSLTAWRPSVTPRSLLVAGFFSGASGTATSVGSPPMALVLQGSSGPELRATLGWFFFFGTSLSLLGLALTGHVTGMHLTMAGWMAVPMALGFSVSGRLRYLVDKGRTRASVLLLVTVSALVLLARSIAGL